MFAKKTRAIESSKPAAACGALATCWKEGDQESSGTVGGGPAQGPPRRSSAQCTKWAAVLETQSFGGSTGSTLEEFEQQPSRVAEAKWSWIWTPAPWMLPHCVI